MSFNWKLLANHIINNIPCSIIEILSKYMIILKTRRQNINVRYSPCIRFETVYSDMLYVTSAQKDYICLDGLYLSFVKQFITKDKSLESVLRFKSNLL